MVKIPMAASASSRTLIGFAAAISLVAGGAVARGPYGARDSDIQTALTQAHQRYLAENSGKVSELINSFGDVSAGSYGVIIVRVDGKVFEAGDTRVAFVLGALAAPFTAALAAQQQGTDVQSSTAGAVAGTAPVPNARTPADFGKAPQNALSGEGAISTLSLVKPQRDVDGKWRALLDNFTNFSGRELTVDERVYRADKPIVPRVLDMARELGTEGRLLDDPAITADLYLRQSALSASAYDLAVMAATLANDGVNPVTRKTAVTPEVAKALQAQLLASRKGSSAWMSKAGIPAAAGISGGIIVVIPGRLGLATYSPPLDSAGVSVRGQRAIRYLSKVLFFTP